MKNDLITCVLAVKTWRTTTSWLVQQKLRKLQSGIYFLLT